jgi:hypothetical protein
MTDLEIERRQRYLDNKQRYSEQRRRVVAEHRAAAGPATEGARYYGHWEKWEDNLIRASYLASGAAYIATLLPHRTVIAIQNRAHRIVVKGRPSYHTDSAHDCAPQPALTIVRSRVDLLRRPQLSMEEIRAKNSGGQKTGPCYCRGFANWGPRR